MLFALFSWLLLFLSLSALEACAQISTTSRKLEVYPPPSGTQQLYSTFNPILVDHAYTTNASEIQWLMDFYGFEIEGTVVGFVYKEQIDGTVPLYRLYSVGQRNHLMTANVKEKDHAVKRLGYHLEGTLGYVFPNATEGHIPLYRLFNPGVIDHYFTSSDFQHEDAARNGWFKQGVAAYVLPEPS